QPAEIVRRTGEGKQPPDFLEPSQLHLLQHADDLHPSKRLLHSLSFLLAQFVTDMPGGPSVDRTGPVRVVLRHMRRDVHPSEFPHELLHVIVLIPAQGHLLDARNLLRHEQPCISFRGPSTVKCSSDKYGCACASTRWKNASAISSFSSRSRFLLNTAWFHTSSSISIPTNHRNSKLYCSCSISSRSLLTE